MNHCAAVLGQADILFTLPPIGLLPSLTTCTHRLYNYSTRSLDHCIYFCWSLLRLFWNNCKSVLAGAGHLCFAQCLRKLKITSLVSGSSAGLGLSSLQYLSLSRPGQSGPAPNLPTPSLSRDQVVPNMSKMWHSSFIVIHHIVKAV